MELDALRIFAKVAEQASFTRAAEQLGLPKGRVSARVQALEAQLGTRLLHRTTRSVRLTSDGELFAERCRELLAEADELQALFQQAPSALRGRLRIDLPVGLARSTVIPQLPAFLAAHPMLEVELSTTDRRVDLVHEGFDCVLRIGRLHDSGLVARRLGALAMANAASPAYLACHGLPQTLDDLGAHLLVGYAQTPGAASAASWEYRLGGEVRSRTLRTVVTVNNADAYQAACLAGLGLVQAPLIGLQPLFDQGRLVPVLPAFTAEPMPVSLLVANRRNLPRRVQAVMAWLAEVLAPQLDAAP